MQTCPNNEIPDFNTCECISQMCISWKTIDQADPDADGVHNSGYFGLNIYNSDNEILHSEPIQFVDMNVSKKICVSGQIAKLNFRTDNGNSWHGVLKIENYAGEVFDLHCRNCPNNAIGTNRIVVDTDSNKYTDWFMQNTAMVCEQNCDIAVLKSRVISTG